MGTLSAIENFMLHANKSAHSYESYESIPCDIFEGLISIWQRVAAVILILLAMALFVTLTTIEKKQ